MDFFVLGHKRSVFAEPTGMAVLITSTNPLCTRMRVHNG